MDSGSSSDHDDGLGECYLSFLAEREEILRHKWLQSERSGHDIGFENALVSWNKLHRTTWKEIQRSERSSQDR